MEGDKEQPPEHFPTNIVVHSRPKFRSGWEERFPFYFDLSDKSVVDELAVSLAGRTGIIHEKPEIRRRSEILLPEEVAPAGVWEGAAKRVMVNVYERDSKARKACLRHWGSKCVICGFDFGAIYGQEFAGFIHVHHLVPLATVGKEYLLDAINDLRPVCPNWHAAIHRRDPPYSLDEVTSFLGTALSTKALNT